MYIYPHCHPSPSTTAAFPSCSSHLPPTLSFTAYVLAACLSLPPYDFGAVLPADSRDAGAAPPVPLAFADRPTAAPLASPAAVPPPAYSLPAAAWAPRPDATRPAVVFAQDALPGAGTPVAATRSAGFQSYTCACTATPLQLNLPPSNLLYLPPTLLHHHLRSLCPSHALSLSLSLSLSLAPTPPDYAPSLQICQVVPTMPMQHHHQQSSHQHIHFRQQQQHGRHDQLHQSVEVDELRNPALV